MKLEEVLKGQKKVKKVIDTHTHPGIPAGGKFDRVIEDVNEIIREKYGDEIGKGISPIDALLNYDIRNSDVLSKRVAVAIDSRRATGAHVSNEEVLELAKGYEEVIPAASFDPKREGALEAVKRACEKGVKVFKTSPPTQHFVPEEDINKDIIEVLDTNEAVLQIHTGREPDYIAKEVKHNLEDPTLSEGLLERTDETLIQFLHAGAPSTEYTKKIIEYMKRFQNARTDLSSVIWPIFPDNEKTVNLIAKAQDELTDDGSTVGEKIYFGSDAPIGLNEGVLPSDFYEMTVPEKGITYGGNEEFRKRLG